MAAILACGEGAILSHRSAAALWGLIRAQGERVDVTSRHGRAGRPGILLHRALIHPEERAHRDRIPVTSVARTLLDLADTLDEQRWEGVAEEAERLGILEMRALERVCARGQGRRGLAPIERLIAASLAPTFTRSRLEERFAALCREHRLPPPAHNVLIGGMEVDALWPRERLIVELDGFAFHRHRAAFERDRARDAALQAAGFRVIRLTWRRLEREPAAVAAEIGRLLLRTRA
jgi:very-short-patch-repair endonuclease